MDHWAIALCCLLGSSACAAQPRGDDVPMESGTAGFGPMLGGGSSGEQTGVDADGGSGGPGETTDDGVLYDVGGADGEIPGQPGCGKVDFLFVIDSSGSMSDEQENLVNSFGGFITALRETLDADDYHVMVVDTDAASCCSLANSCNGFSCSTLPPKPMDACQDTLGAGVVHPWGQLASNTMCPMVAGRRYMASDDVTLPEAFACAGKVGVTGWGGEKQAQAAVAAVSPVMNGAGGCNEGFVRDDAILVVTVITDEEDAPLGGGLVDGGSTGEPADWAMGLTLAKGGNADTIVVLGLVGDADLPGSICQGPSDGGGADPAPRLREFFGSFEHHVIGSVCAPDYAPFFEEAIGVIDTSCDEFVPPG